MSAHRIGETYRSQCGAGRATFAPDCGDTVRPWIVAVRGAVRNHAATLQQAQRMLRAYGCRVGDKP